MKIKIEVSARHVHLSNSDMEVLFGKGYVLSHKKELSQPGQFACEERVEIEGPKGKFSGVIVLSPCRAKTQVELSITDCIKLGIKPVVRESGDLSGSSGCKIIGPNGVVNIEEGVIVAHRHVHMNVEEAKILGAKDGQIGKIRINSEYRSLIFEDVVIRVNQNYSLAMHIDTDEANAAGLTQGILGEFLCCK